MDVNSGPFSNEEMRSTKPSRSTMKSTTKTPLERKQMTKLKKQLAEKTNKLTEVTDKLAQQERETEKVTKDRNELLEYVELLEQKIEKQSQEIDGLKGNGPLSDAKPTSTTTKQVP